MIVSKGLWGCLAKLRCDGKQMLEMIETESGLYQN